MQPALTSRDKNETESSPASSRKSRVKERQQKKGGAELWGGQSARLGLGKLGSSSQALCCVTWSRLLPLLALSFFIRYFRV